MTPGPALRCPSCKRSLGPEAWIDARNGVCLACETSFEFDRFPALTAAKQKVAPQTAVLAADSVCFFHAENRAEAVCDGCGRLLCPVCTISLGAQRICPSCMAASRRAETTTVVVRSRVLFDRIALAVAFFPLLLWPLTLVSAPVALGLVFYGWKKPGSLVRGASKVRFVAAGIIALLQVAGWVTFFTFLWLRK
jgi:hypothetical protein